MMELYKRISSDTEMNLAKYMLCESAQYSKYNERFDSNKTEKTSNRWHLVRGDWFLKSKTKIKIKTFLSWFSQSTDIYKKILFVISTI